jgi:uncharacterized protein YcfJ
MMLGEITPFILALLLGLLFGTQFSGQLSRRAILTVIGLAVVAAFLFEALPFTTSIFGGFINDEFSFSTSLLGAIIGLLIGKYIGGK